MTSDDTTTSQTSSNDATHSLTDLNVTPPSMLVRGGGLFLEVATYLVIVMIIAIVEFYVGGFDFLSNWWLGVIVFLAWQARSWGRSTSPIGTILQTRVLDTGGQLAGFTKTATRSIAKMFVMYVVPLLVLRPGVVLGDVDGYSAASVSNSLFLALAVVLGAAIAFLPMRRAPWDLLAGTVLDSGIGEVGGTDNIMPAAPADLRLSGLRKQQNDRAGLMLQIAALSSILVSGLILFVVSTEALQFVREEDFSWSLLTDIGWFPRRDLFDLSTLLVGTGLITVIAMMVAAPVGLGVAFYLSEYASPKVARIVKPIIETLASVPSVVIGFFAIAFFGRSFLPIFFEDIGIFSFVAAGLGVGVLTIPIVASIAEDALRAVPQELREAAYGLGRRRVTVATKVVFPAALSGISAALIVGISRAIGETMVVAIAAGGAGGSIFETNPVEGGLTITAAMASLGVGTDEVAGSGIAFQSLYFLGFLLFVITFVLNLISDVVVRRFREVY